MKGLERLSRTPWVAVGLVVGLLLAPAAAIGAASLVGIVGQSGKRADVTKANQLQVAAATPGQFRGYRETGIANTCKPAFTAPTTKSYVMTGVTFNVFQNTTPGLANWIGLFRDASCTETIVLHNADGLGGFNVPFEPGFGVRAGQTIYTSALGNVRGELYVYGYLVAKGAVPATTQVSARPGASTRAANQ
jgi:hypothetical protein